MTEESTSDLVLEVDELTDLLRSDSAFRNLRGALLDHGIDPNRTLLAGLIDDEQGGRYCAFVTAAGVCIATEVTAGGQVIRWEVVQASSIRDDFGAIDVAVARAEQQ